MIVKINTNTVTITGNPTLERNIREELDTGKIKIVSTRSARYEMYDTVDITTDFGTEQYLVQGDNPVQLNATEYQHNITLFENIGFFQTVYPADRSFKIIGQTLEDILTAYKRELESYHNILITWTTIPQTVLDEEIPFKEFSGLNFASILMSLFRKIWAVPKVNRDSGNWDIYPLYHNEKNNEISHESITVMSQQNSVDYATQIKSQLKNAVNERLEADVTWFPSENGYVLPRSSSLEKITSKLRYELDSDIITLLKVEAVDISLETTNVTGTITYNYNNIDIDITNQIVQEEVWDLLPVIVDTHDYEIVLSNNVKNNVRYKVGDKYITNLFEASSDGIIFKNDTEYLINAIWKAWYDNTGKDPEFGEIPNDFAPALTEDIKLRFKYVRRRDMDIVHSRKTRGAMNVSTAIHQQRDSSVEVNEYKKVLNIYANQMGNNQYSKTKVFADGVEPYNLFDYTDNKTIVTRVQNTYHNNFTYCEYEESENFSNIEAEYALMRRSDPYTISAKSVTTNLVIQESIEFTTQARDLETRLLSDARRLLLGLFEATTIGIDKVAVGVFKPIMTSWNDSYAIRMPIETSGDGNLITLHVHFPHQTIAGKTYYDLATDTYEDYLNPLAYTEDNGTLENFELYFTPDVLFEDSGEYPLILDETDYQADAHTTSGVIEPIDLDSSASFAVTFELNLISDENIYIGNALARSNYFIKDQATTSAIAIYTSTKPYGQYDQAPRSYDTDNTLNVAYTYSFANRTITITPSIDIDYFSIVKDSKILLAINKTLASGSTYTININHISSNVAIASQEILMSVEALSEFVWYQKLNQVFAVDVEPVVATSDFALYQALNQVFDSESQVTTSMSMTYEVAFNQRFDTEEVVVASSSIVYLQGIDLPLETEMQVNVDSVLDYYIVADRVLDSENEVTASDDLVYYTVRDIETNINQSVTTSTDLSYTLIGDKAKVITMEVTASVDVNTTYDPNPNPVEWVEVSSGTPDIDQCIYLSDAGNIRARNVTVCEFIQDGDSYTSSTDLTTTPPTCQTNATYTVCLPFGGEYYCQDYVGQSTTTQVLEECQVK